MVEVIWTEAAIADINGIAAYIALDSPARADAFTERIFANADPIALFPGGGRIVPESDNQRIREVFEGWYRIIYWWKDANTAWVLVVWHGRRRLPKRIVKNRRRQVS